MTLSVSDTVTVSENLQISSASNSSLFESVVVSEDIQLVVESSLLIFESVTVTENFTSDTTIWVYEPQVYAPRGTINIMGLSYAGGL